MAKVEKSSGRGSAPGERRGGRKKGTPNKKTQEQIETVKATGQTPLEFLTSVYQSPIPPELIEKAVEDPTNTKLITALTGWFDRRIDAAGKAAPYVHAKLVAVHETDGNKVSFSKWLTQQAQQNG